MERHLLARLERETSLFLQRVLALFKNPRLSHAEVDVVSSTPLFQSRKHSASLLFKAYNFRAIVVKWHLNKYFSTAVGVNGLAIIAGTKLNLEKFFSFYFFSEI